MLQACGRSLRNLALEEALHSRSRKLDSRQSNCFVHNRLGLLQKNIQRVSNEVDYFIFPT